MDPVAHCESKHTERTETNFLYPLGGPSVLKSKLEYTALSIFIFYLLGSGFIRPEDIPFFFPQAHYVYGAISESGNG